MGAGVVCEFSADEVAGGGLKKCLFMNDSGVSFDRSDIEIAAEVVFVLTAVWSKEFPSNRERQR